jgi:hypothetical protein
MGRFNKTGPKPRDIIERLKEKTLFSANHWLWMGYALNGYGKAKYMGKQRFVHRISAHIYLGLDLDSELNVNHKCEFKHCWNPDCLYVGTQTENVADSVKSGTHKVPEYKTLMERMRDEDELDAKLRSRQGTV